LREALATIPLTRLRDAGVLDTLLDIAGLRTATDAPAGTDPDQDEEMDVDEMDADSLVRLVLDRAESSP
jgi:hypothetical protein